MLASVLFAAMALVASSRAQAVPEGIAPEQGPPPGCKTTVDGNFTIGIATSLSKHRRDSETAQEAAENAFLCTLEDGILKDPYGRIGSVVANYQFQFDGPPQAGAIYTGGFSVCKNTSLAIGDSARWWRCMSGDFGNLYDRSIGDQCSEVRIVAMLVDKPSPSPSSTPAASSSSWSVESATTTAPVFGNGTVSTETPSGSGSPSASITPSPSATGTEATQTTGTSSGSTGAAVPTRVPRRETFGAVIGLLGAALLI